MDGEDFEIIASLLLGLCLAFVIGFCMGSSAEKKDTKEARGFCQEFCLKYQPSKECLDKCGR